MAFYVAVGVGTSGERGRLERVPEIARPAGLKV
jgi:hypothetical protein